MAIFAVRRRDHEDRRRPLDAGLIRRIFTYTTRHAARRNWLLVLVLLRSLQLPALGWMVARILSGPIAQHDGRGLFLWLAAFVALVLTTEVMFVYRVRFALELGEAVIHDLRNDLFDKVLRMPVSFFHRTPLGRLISRITSDVDSIRLAIQDSAFIGLVQLGSMAVAAALMAWYDLWLFLTVMALVPILWALLHFFHTRLERAYRDMQESFSGSPPRWPSR
jgi:ATP-binding cassette subfamily B protein